MFSLLLLAFQLCCQESPFVQLNDSQVYVEYYPAEDLPVVILEAGARGTTQVWRNVVPLLQDAGFGMLLYDRPGLGQSTPTERPRSAEQIAEDLQQLIDKLNIQQPLILAGHSMGGLYVSAFATQYPSKVLAMIMIDTPHASWEAKLNACLTPAQQQARLEALQHMRSNAGASVRREYEMAETNFKFIEDHPLSGIPVGLVVGNNQSWPAAYDGNCLSANWMASQQTYKKSLKNAVWKVSSRSGHQIPLEDPAIIVDLIKEIHP